MKRLNLEAFKAQKLDEHTEKVDQLLGQILGDCHVNPDDDCDGDSGSNNEGGGSSGGSTVGSSLFKFGPVVQTS
jgi:hypothetical protein